MSIRTTFPTPIPFKSSAWYTATLTDRLGVVIPSSALSTLTLTYYAPNYAPVSPGTNIINNRNAQNVLNANQVTVSAGGVLTWALTTTDTDILDSNVNIEVHTALFEWYGADVGYGKHEVSLVVERIAKVA